VWYTGAAESVQDGVVGDPEVLTDHSERLTGLVHLLSGREVVVAEDAVARLHADPSQEAEDGGAVNAELLGEAGGWFTGEVALQQLGPLRIAAAPPRVMAPISPWPRAAPVGCRGSELALGGEVS